MKTDQLIKALAADHAPEGLGLGQRLAVGVLIALAVSAVLFLWWLGMRRDMAAAVMEPRFLLKFPVTLTLAASGAVLALRLARPGATLGPWALMLAIGPALLAAGIAAELVMMPPATWMPRLIGRSSMVCLGSIPLLAAPLLVAVLMVLRQGAPTRPALAGAAAGLVSGALGAALYALHCLDDSPLFVATWYGIGIGALTLVGAAVGARVLRW